MRRMRHQINQHHSEQAIPFFFEIDYTISNFGQLRSNMHSTWSSSVSAGMVHVSEVMHAANCNKQTHKHRQWHVWTASENNMHTYIHSEP